MAPRCIQWSLDNKEQGHRDGPTTIREKGCREGAANVKDVGVTGKGQELLGKAHGEMSGRAAPNNFFPLQGFNFELHHCLSGFQRGRERT